MDARDMIFGPEPFVSPCLTTAPRRSLVDLRLELVARRLDLMRQQLDAKNALARLAPQIADVEDKLRVIEAAEVPVLRVVGSLDAVTGGV